MSEAFVERGTEFLLDCGKLTVYETNMSCRDVKFYFGRYNLTLMLAGHKSIVTDSLQLEFFPGTFYIPQRDTVHTIHIPNASFDNPTKCLVLEPSPYFLHRYYQELRLSEGSSSVLHSAASAPREGYFLSNDSGLVDCFKGIYSQTLKSTGRSRDLIVNLRVKELLLRIFQTEGLHLLKEDLVENVADPAVQKSLSFIQSHLTEKITVEQLSMVAGLGKTTFFKKFKEALGMSPADYMVRERVKLAKEMILKNQLSLKEIAFRSGFNSYEYFCLTFKRLTGMKPSQLKKQTALLQQ